MFIVTGHPRSGTGMAAKMLRQVGFDIGHERLGVDGISSWMWVAAETQVPYGHGYDARVADDAFWIYLVRDPIDCLASVVFTENGSLPFRCKYADISPYHIDSIQHGIESMIGWYELFVHNHFDKDGQFVKTEYFGDYLRIHGHEAEDVQANSRKHPEFDRDAIRAGYPDIKYLEDLWARSWGG